MAAEPDPSPSAQTVTVVLDPRVAYAGFGPDDGALAAAARSVRADDVLDDLADAAEQLDHAYRLAWQAAARRIAPDVDWQVSAPYHRPVGEFALRRAIAQTDRDGAVPMGLLERVSAQVTVEVETLSVGNTRWAVIDSGRMVGSATVPWTVGSVQDRHVADVASRIISSCELLRSNEYDGIRLDVFEPTAELGSGAGHLGYILTDYGTPVFAGVDFRPSPLHAIDSDRTVEALAEFLALREGDTDGEFFSNYTERQRFWIEGSGPDRLHELVAELPGDTEYGCLMRGQTANAGQDLVAGLWQVKPVARTDLPTALLIASNADTAREQYPGYVAAWMEDTGRDIDLDDELFPALDAQRREPVGAPGRTAVTAVRGQHTLDWAVEHANRWGLDVVIPVDNLVNRPPLNIPATGRAIVAIRNARAVAHDGAQVDAYNRSRVIALAGSHIEIHPGACVDRRRGSRAVVAADARPPRDVAAPRMRTAGRDGIGR